MDMVYFSASLPMGFIPAEWKDDGTYTEETWPTDAVLCTEEEAALYWKQPSPDGYDLGATDTGRPIWVPVPPPSSEAILIINSAKLQQETQLAAQQKTALANRIGTLQDAVDLEEATPEEIVELPLRQAQLLEWKRYAIYLGRVTTQSGWHMTVDWPQKPAQGMDLSVSAVSRSAQSAI